MSAFEPITIASPDSAVCLEVIPYGLTIQSISVDGQDVVPSFQDPKSHGPPNRCFFAPLVGRFANRLPAGEVPFGSGADGSAGVAHLPEFSAPGISHHGGPATDAAPHAGILQQGPFDQCVFTRLPMSEAQVVQHAELPAMAASELFALESPHNDQGYPGHVRLEVVIGISQGSSAQSKGQVHLIYRARLLDATPATPLNLTHHWGFNLSAASSSPEAISENGLIDAHTMTINPIGEAEVARLDTDAAGLPTGKLLPIAQDDPHDFGHGGKVLGNNMPEGGYDHFYFWGPVVSQAEKDKPRVRLASPTTKLAIDFRTDQPGMQLYTTNGQPAYPASAEECGGMRKVVHNHGGDVLQASLLGNHQRSSAMIEFGAPHATFLHPSLQSAAGTDALLRNGQVYCAHTSAEFLSL